MSVYLDDLLDPTELQQDIHNGYIRTQEHPEFPYTILNYTEKAQYEGHWTEATLMCRGLIYDHNSGKVIARPFPKFFNYSQLTDPPGPETELLSVTDKMDGSLGIIYHGPDASINVATRGSFTSEQALWATKWIQNNDVYLTGPHFWDVRVGLRSMYSNLLVEIVYPDNRIVLDYGDREGLVLLGAVDKETGRIIDPQYPSPWLWNGERTETFPQYKTLADVLSAPNRENAEGLVVRTKDNQLIKFKQEDYVKLHRVLTGLTERTVYDMLKEDGNVDRLIEIVPDEFHPWVQTVATHLNNDRVTLLNDWNDLYEEIIELLPWGFTQKDFALQATQYDSRAALFLIHKNDTERLNELAWKLIEPPATKATVPSSTPV